MSKIALALILLLPLIGNCQTINYPDTLWIHQYAQEQKIRLGYEWVVLNDTLSVIYITDPYRGIEDTIRFCPEENPWKYYIRKYNKSVRP